jgi:hypothetical protein
VDTFVSSLSDLSHVSLVFSEEFAEIPEFHQAEIGNDPIGVSAMPIYSFLHGSICVLPKVQDYASLLEACGRILDEEYSVETNPYMERAEWLRLPPDDRISWLERRFRDRNP